MQPPGAPTSEAYHRTGNIDVTDSHGHYFAQNIAKRFVGGPGP